MRTLTRNMSFSRSVRVSTSLGVNCARGDDERHRGGNHQRRRGVEDDAALGTDDGATGLLGGQEDGHVDVAQLEDGDHLAARRQDLARLGEPVQHPTPDRRAERAVGDVRPDALDPGGGRGDGRVTIVDVDPRRGERRRSRLALRLLLQQRGVGHLHLGLGLDQGAVGDPDAGALLRQPGHRGLHPREILVQLLAGDEVAVVERLRALQLLARQRQLALALDDRGLRLLHAALALGHGRVGATAIALPLGDAGHRTLHVALALGDDRERAPLVLARLPGLRLGLVEVRVEIPRVHASEDLSGLHHVALAHRDGGDPPRPLGGDVVLGGLDAAVARREAGGERGTPKSLHQLRRDGPGLGRVREERPGAQPEEEQCHTEDDPSARLGNDHLGFGGGFHHALPRRAEVQRPCPA